MSELKLRVLGALQLEREGKIVEFETRKAVAILVYLAMTGQNHSRDTLATLFWPEYEQSRARTYLRRALWMLKKEIGEEVLGVGQQQVGLHPEACLWLDVTHFRQLVARCEGHSHKAEEVCGDCIIPLTEAAEQYRGDFLSGFSLPDAPEFDEWQFFQTEGLKQELATVLEGLVRGHRGQAAYDAAIPHARRWVALDPLNEPAQRQLMWLYVQAGRRHEALRQYQVCVETFETELGSPPGPETTALYQQIAGGDVGPPSAATSIPVRLPPFSRSNWLMIIWNELWR